jgi:hypothetical protein
MRAGARHGDFRTPEPIGEPSIIPNLSAITTGAFDPLSAIEQKAMDLHHPVDPLVVRGLQTRGQRLAAAEIALKTDNNGIDLPIAPKFAAANHR